MTSIFSLQQNGLRMALAALLTACTLPVQAAERVKIILDTDVVLDSGDPAAIAFLHGLADRGEAEILAMTVVSSHPYGAGCADAINRYYGRPEIPLGQLKNKEILNKSGYAEQIAKKYPNRYPDGPTHVPDAVAIFREAIAKQPDGSVVVVAIGPLSNLENFLKSTPDQYSPLNGRDLIAKRVKLLSQMAAAFGPVPKENVVPGKFKEFNVVKDPGAAIYVAENWPTPIVFSGYEVGADIWTGGGITAGPVRDAIGYNGERTRPTWDQTSILYGVRGAGDYWDVKTNGFVEFHPDATNLWKSTPDKGHSYLIQKMDPGKLGKLISGIEAAAGANKPGEGAPAAALPKTNTEVPAVLHETDLFRPYADPDDHWDLACVYALSCQKRLDLKSVLIDSPPLPPKADGKANPDIGAVAQMNGITGQAVPIAIGSSRICQPGETLALADSGGVASILDHLKNAPNGLYINIVGSARDVAAAIRQNPDLFKAKCRGIYLNSGWGARKSTPEDKLEYNVALDPRSYADIFHAPCPVYWLPCFGPEGYSTFYKFKQGEILPFLPHSVSRFFAFALAKDASSDWLSNLKEDRHPEVLAAENEKMRNMWCTAGFLHLAGLGVDASGAIKPLAELGGDSVFEFEPMRVTCDDKGRTEWVPDPKSTDRFIFHVRDQAHYTSAMVTAMKTLLQTMP
ncbi:MAG: nucleoside hydrolase [Terrimicrobiaceae bacterium]